MRSQNERLEIQRVENAVLPMATAALETGQLETARRLYGRLLELDPKSFQARMGLGEAALRDRQPAAAARWYGEAIGIAQAPAQRHEALLAHGRAALESGQLAAARESFARLASPDEQAPRISVAWGLNGVGLAWLLEDDLPQAVQFMEQAIRQAPSELVFQENLDRAKSMLAENGERPEQGPEAALPIPPDPRAPTASESAALEETLLPEEAAIEEAEVALADISEAADETAAEQVAEAPPDAAQPPAEPLPGEAGDQPSANDEPLERQATLTETASAAAAAEEIAPAEPQPRRNVRGFLLREDGEQFAQMGAYGVRASAVGLAARLRTLTDERVFVVEGPQLHRVRIGPIPSQSALDALSDALEAAGFGRLRAGPAARQDGEAEADDPFPNSPTAWSGRPLVFTSEAGRFMQFGAYRARAKAEALAQRLQELLEVPVFIMEAQPASGALVHRVRAGPIESEATYRALSSAAESLGFLMDRPR